MPVHAHWTGNLTGRRGERGRERERERGREREREREIETTGYERLEMCWRLRFHLGLLKALGLQGSPTGVPRS